MRKIEEILKNYTARAYKVLVALTLMIAESGLGRVF